MPTVAGAAYARWHSHSAAMRAKYGLPTESTPWTSQARLAGLGPGPRERERDLLDIAWSVRRGQNPYLATGDLAKGFWCDLSQSVHRRPWGAIPTLCRSTRAYSFEADTMLTGHSHLRLLGHGRTVAPHTAFPDAELRKLAGDGYSLPIAACCALAYYANPWGPWWGDHQRKD